MDAIEQGMEPEKGNLEEHESRSETSAEHEASSPEETEDVSSANSSEDDKNVEECNIQVVESSLREGLSLNHEEARALMGRLEYQRGNIEAALRVFDGIDLQAGIERLKPSLLEKPSKRNRSQNDSTHSVSQHAASLLLEAIYLKSLSCQKLGIVQDAAEVCQSILDAVENMFCQGMRDVVVENKLQETVSKAVELLPELWKQAGNYQETISAYRRALLGQWNLDDDCCTRIQKRFVMFLLYSGIEACPPMLVPRVEGSFVPKNNMEEAILLSMVLLQKWYIGKAKWDPLVLENFTFALSMCGQCSMLARQLEEILPGIYPRCDRWNTLALCYSASGNNKDALNLLRKSLNKHEKPDDLMALLLASRICSEDCLLAGEGVEYANQAVVKAQGKEAHLKGVGLRFLGICFGRQAKVASSDQQRSYFQAEALRSLNEAIVIESRNPDLFFELGLEYAEQRNMNAALRCAKKFIDSTGGSVMKGWRLLALILSAQQRYLESEVVTCAALDETVKWEQGALLRLKAKLKAFQSLHKDSVETYRLLLALVQAQRKSFGSSHGNYQVEDDKVTEFEVWHGLANVYSSLSQWKDTEICLEKARVLRPYSASMLHIEGAMHEAHGRNKEALVAYSDALSFDLNHVPCKISMAALLSKSSPTSSSVARGFLSDALRIDPTNRSAWYHLGMVHREDGRLSDAAECFQAASVLEESDPIESFSSIAN